MFVDAEAEVSDEEEVKNRKSKLFFPQILLFLIEVFAYPFRTKKRKRMISILRTTCWMIPRVGIQTSAQSIGKVDNN